MPKHFEISYKITLKHFEDSSIFIIFALVIRKLSIQGMERIFKRKIYSQILDWKKTKDGKTALLIKGARRVGKSTIAEEFAKNEYRSYIVVDFADAPAALWEAVENISDRDYFFTQLQFIYGVQLYERESVIIFDEIQKCPQVRQAIKYLVKDYRFDYIETGSLLSIKKIPPGLSSQVRKQESQCVRWTMRNFVGHSEIPLRYLS